MQLRSTTQAKIAAKEGVATKNCLVALFHSMFLVLPFKSVKVWCPDVLALPLQPSTVRAFDPVAEHWYNWDSETHQSTWAFSVLLLSRKGSVVRILCVVADMGSELFSAVQFMALRWSLRVMLHPDPLHRWSNVFTNAMKAVKAYRTLCCQLLWVMKYRRAPFASGLSSSQSHEQGDIKHIKYR